MAWMGIKAERTGLLLPILITIALALTGCEFQSFVEEELEGEADTGGGVSSKISTISGSAGTSVTPADVTVVLMSEDGFPLANQTPVFTVAPRSENDFGFTCGATNHLGEAKCSFRSYDAEVPKTLMLTSPITISGNTVTFERAASQIIITTEPNTDFPTGGEVRKATGFVAQPIVALHDPLDVLVSKDSSTEVEVTINTIATENPATPTLYKSDVACADPCTVRATTGIIDFGSTAQLATDIAGTFTFTFSGKDLSEKDLTAATSEEWQTRATVGDTIEFIRQPPEYVAIEQEFKRTVINEDGEEEVVPAPVAVAVKDEFGNIVSIRPVPGNNDHTANITLGIQHPDDSSAAILGNDETRADAGVADYKGQGIKVRSTVTGIGITLEASATLGLKRVTATSELFELTDVGIPAKLIFTTQPSLRITTADPVTDLPPITQQPIVELQDNHGNRILTENARQITINIANHPDDNCEDEPPSVGGPNSVTMVAGVARFSGLSITKDMSDNCDFYQLVASIGSLSSVVGPTTSEIIFVGDAGTVAEKLAFGMQPMTAGANQTMPPFTVQIQDGADNLVSSENSTMISLSIPDDGTEEDDGTRASLGGIVSRVVVNGAATFDDITISKPGVYTLLASANDNYLTAAESDPFYIDTSGTASAIEFTHAPGDGRLPEVAGMRFADNPTPGDPIVAVKLIDEHSRDVALGGIRLELSCTNPADCELIGPNLVTITRSDGHATFPSKLQINESTGNNLQLTATALDESLNINPGSTLTGFTVQAADPSNVNSSIAADAPTGVDINDGIVTIVLKDKFQNPVEDADITLSHDDDAALCTSLCPSTSASGVAECSFGCDTASISVKISIHRIDVNAKQYDDIITKFTTITMPPPP